MIDRQHNSIAFECDACPEVLETGEAEFSDAMAQFRRDGWKAEKIGDEWIHLCPNCQGRR